MPTTETSPSREAIDAAKAIELNHVFGRMEPERVNERAAIIDREFAPLRAEMEKFKCMPALLLECRDALPAISLAAARLHNVSLSLADRIETALAPWEIKE